MKQKDDADLIRLIKRGDNQAFQKLMERYHQLICHIIWATYPNPDLIDDLIQEVYLSVYKAIPGYKMTGSFKSWVGRITRNKCIDHLRTKRETSSLEELADLESNHSLSDEMLNEEMREEVRAVLAQLPELYRVTIFLRYYNDFTYNEISETLEIPLGTVMSRLHKGRQLLKEGFEKAKIGGEYKDGMSRTER